VPVYYGWVIVAVAFVTMAISVNSRSVFSLLFPALIEDMGWDRATIAAAFSIGFLSAVIYAPLIGIALDRLGPRIVIPCAAGTVATGLWLTTLVTSPWELYVSYGLLVIGASIPVSYMGHGVILPRWFERKRGLATGIAFSGVGIGGIILFPWLQGLIDGPGWRQACIAIAVLLVLVVIPLNLLAQRSSPAAVGAKLDGERDRPGDPAPVSNIVDHAWASIDWTVAKAICTLRFWWFFAAMTSAMFVWYALLVHQTNHLLDVGFLTDQAALALGLVPFVGAIGQVGIGHLSDRVGREWTWTLCCTGFAAAYVAMSMMQDAGDVWLIYVMIIAQGGFGYGLASMTSAIPAEIFAGRNFGSIYGVLSISAATGASSGPWVTGKIFDTYGSYDLAFTIGLGVCVFSIVCVWLAGPRKVRLVAGQAAKRERTR
jgi:MFS family permease